jgi:hypothetical protein
MNRRADATAIARMADSMQTFPGPSMTLTSSGSFVVGAHGESSNPVASAPARWNDQARKMLKEWHLRATAAQFGYQTKAQKSRKANLLLGVPVVALTTIVGTSVFVALTKDPATWVKILAGAMTILAAVLAAIQTFLAYAQVTENNRVAASRYAMIRRHIELAIVRKDANAIDRIRSEMDKAGAASQPIGDNLWEESLVSARQEIDGWHDGQAHDVSFDDEA